ncbi:MAG: type III secretion system chaperone [Mailhella sp.]|nr:type III secretion system chaperone [Mailhella sp.]
MPSKLQQIADIITNAAGWKRAEPDSEGVFRFSLEGGLDFSLLSPDNRTAVLLADLGPAPEAGTMNGNDKLKRLAALAAGTLKKRRSSFAIAGQRLELSRTFSMQAASELEISPLVRDFLNDLAWWKAQISGSSNTSSNTSSSPFSMGGWFSGF